MFLPLPSPRWNYQTSEMALPTLFARPCILHYELPRTEVTAFPSKNNSWCCVYGAPWGVVFGQLARRRLYYTPVWTPITEKKKKALISGCPFVHSALHARLLVLSNSRVAQLNSHEASRLVSHQSVGPMEKSGRRVDPL